MLTGHGFSLAWIERMAFRWAGDPHEVLRLSLPPLELRVAHAPGRPPSGPAGLLGPGGQPILSLRHGDGLS